MDLYQDVLVDLQQVGPPPQPTSLAAVPADASLAQQLAAAQAELQQARASEQSAREELAALRQREAGLAAEAAARQGECITLRRELAAARQSAEPSVVQLRQVLLDPAVNREVGRLRAELEQCMRSLATAQVKRE